MGFSPWKIFFHPQLTSRIMDEMEDAAATVQDCQKERMELQSIRDKLVAENQHLSLQLQEAQTTSTNLKSSLNTERTKAEGLRIQLEEVKADALILRKELDETKGKLAEMESVKKQLDQFVQSLSRVEAMKAHYERRIASLRKALENNAGTGHINDNQKTAPDGEISPIEPSPPPKPDRDEWLQELDL